MEKAVEDFMRKLERFVGDEAMQVERSMFVDFDDSDFLQVFTEKRLELMKSIKDVRPDSIRELAGRLERDIKNVYDDLCILEKSNFIGFETTGRKKVPFLKRDVVILKFW